MSDEIDRNDEIAMFMEISGTDFETAKQTLSANDYNLEQAINCHLERTNALNAPENDVAAASTSTGPNLPMDDEEVVRPPILPKREQLLMPNEDNFRYRKRRTAATRSVCPLRNFEHEGQMQEELLKAAVFDKFAHANHDDDDDDTELDFTAIPKATKATAINQLGFDNATKAIIQAKIIGGHQSTAPSRLSELFRPPVDINFCGSFQAARDYAKEQNRWLIVNVQDMSDFSCQVLNRDIWSSDKLRDIIKKYFIFWQVAIDSADGHRFQVFYDIKVFPYVGVIDPRTGEEKLSYKTGFKLTLKEFMAELGNYLKENTPHPNAEPAELDEVLVEDFDTFNTKSTQDSNNHQSLLASPQPKRKRLEPSSLSEQEQIALAIGNSLREVTAEEDKDNDSFGEDDEDGDSDFGNYDDESSNQSFVKSQTSQNAFDTKLHVVSENNEAECEPPKANDIASTIKTIETYESYLGDANDPKARIQLRLPNGERDIIEWPCSSKLKALKLYIPLKFPDLTGDNAYKVIFFGGQSSNVLDMDDILTLKEANLFPTVILHLRNDD